MTTLMLDRPRPANVRTTTNVPVNASADIVVCVEENEVWPRTDWPRDDFFRWFDRAWVAAGFKNEYELARAAGVSHSSISSWRKGRQRPGNRSLSKLAPHLGVTVAEILQRAGADEAPLLGAASASFGFTASATGTVIEPSAEDRAAIARIRDSKLSKPLQDRLIKEHLEARRIAREEFERQLQVQIEMMEGGKS